MKLGHRQNNQNQYNKEKYLSIKVLKYGNLDDVQSDRSFIITVHLL